MNNIFNKYSPEFKDRIFISIGILCVLFFSIFQAFFSNVMKDAVWYMRESWTMAESLRRFEWFGNLPVGLHGFIFKLPLTFIYLVLGKPSVIAAICVNVAYCLAIVPLSYYLLLRFIRSRIWSLCAVMMLVTSYNFILAEATFLREIPAMLTTLLLLDVLVFRKRNLLLTGFMLLLVLDAKEMNFYAYLPGVYIFYLIYAFKTSNSELSNFKTKICVLTRGLRDCIAISLPSFAYIILSLTTSLIPNNPYTADLFGLSKDKHFLAMLTQYFGANTDVHKGGAKLSTIEGIIINEDGNIARPPPQKFETISVSLWFRSDTKQSVCNKPEYLYAITDRSAWAAFTIYQINGRIRVLCGVQRKTPGVYLESQEMLSDDKWHHLFAHFDPQDSLSLFVDGKLSRTVKASAFSFGFRTSQNFLIGAFCKNPSDLKNFGGEIDEVYTWNNILNMRLEHQAKTAAKLYANGKGLFIRKVGDKYLFNDQTLDTKRDYLVSVFKFDTSKPDFNPAVYDIIYSRCLYAINSPIKSKGVDGDCAQFIKDEGQFFSWPKPDVSPEKYKKKQESKSDGATLQSPPNIKNNLKIAVVPKVMTVSEKKEKPLPDKEKSVIADQPTQKPQSEILITKESPSQKNKVNQSPVDKKTPEPAIPKIQTALNQKTFEATSSPSVKNESEEENADKQKTEKLSDVVIKDSLRTPNVILATVNLAPLAISLDDVKPRLWKTKFRDGISLQEFSHAQNFDLPVKASAINNSSKIRLKLTVAKITNIIIELLNRIYITFCKIFYPRCFSWLSFPKLVIVPSVAFSILFFRRCLRKPRLLTFSILPLIYWFYLFFFVARFNFGRYLLSISPLIFFFFVQFLKLASRYPKYGLKVILLTIPFIIGGFFFEVQYLPIKMILNTFFIALLVAALTAKKLKYRKFANIVLIIFVFLYCFFAAGVGIASSYTIGQISKYLKYGYSAEADKIAKILPKNEKIWLGKNVEIDTLPLYHGDETLRHKTGQELKEWLPKKEKLIRSEDLLIQSYYWDSDKSDDFIKDCRNRGIKRIAFVISMLKKEQGTSNVEKQLDAILKHHQSELETKVELKNKTVYIFKIN